MSNKSLEEIILRVKAYVFAYLNSTHTNATRSSMDKNRGVFDRGEVSHGFEGLVGRKVGLWDCSSFCVV